MAKVKILFLDDEPVLGECFSDEFASSEVEIITFTDPKRAVEECLKINPDAIFVDYRMPGLTGDSVAQLLPNNTPKFLITGELEPKVAYKFEQILKKPYEYDKIHLIIKELINKKSTT